MPRQIRFIVSMEACERFSYYGMLSILTLYLSRIVGMGDDGGKQVVHLFATAVYFLPLFGGWLADRWLGRYWTILWLSLFYCLGHAALALFEGNIIGVFAGLALIAMGAGGIKPCVSAFVGDQFTTPSEEQLTRVYGLFYWSINIGAFFGFALIPWVRDHAGYSWAFGVPGIFMGLATLIFWAGRHRYVRPPPARNEGRVRFLAPAWHLLTGRGQATAYRSEEFAAAKAVGRIVLIFITVPVFWALFNQVHTTWVIQATRMTPFHALGFKVDAERMQSAGAAFVLFWVPVLTLLIYPFVERLGLRPTALRRMGFGMVLAAISFVVCGLVQSKIQDGASLSIAWQILTYAILEAGEVMVSATALEFAFSQAPTSMKSTIMSIWLMTIAGGHFLVAAITNINSRFVHATGAAEFYFYAGLMALVAIVFAIIASRHEDTADNVLAPEPRATTAEL
ncbi:MAG: POT family MFS transporter [Verrucomicrobia subdivision 3 bacterium]|nr:POT family MFS transporter [Limisphaerales bacterium]